MRRLLFLIVAFIIFGALVFAEFAPRGEAQIRGSGPIETPEQALEVFRRLVGDQGVEEPYEVVARMATTGDLQSECPLGAIYAEPFNLPIWVVAARGEVRPDLFNVRHDGPPGRQGKRRVFNFVFVRIDAQTGWIMDWASLADARGFDCIAAMPEDRRVPIDVTPVPVLTPVRTPWPTPVQTPPPYPGP